MLRVQRQYTFDDFQLDNIGNREEVNMECGITIPIRNIADLPMDIIQIVNNLVSKTMGKFERKYGKIANSSSLRLNVWLQVDENGLNEHYIGVILFDNLGNDERTNIYIHSKDNYYLSFAKYCTSILNRYLFTM